MPFSETKEAVHLETLTERMQTNAFQLDVILYVRRPQMHQVPCARGITVIADKSSFYTI